MSVTRRTALKQVLFVSAGMALLPACLQKTAPASISLKNIDVDADGEKMLAALAETIIPTTSTPGAKEVAAHLFALTMVDDCFRKDEQQQWISGMKAFEAMCKKKHGHSFIKSTAPEREALLTALEAEKADSSAAAHFYHVTKRLTIQGYTSSKYYLTNVQVYELVPARWHGNVPVKQAAKKIA